jgi:hypothetical protein
MPHKFNAARRDKIPKQKYRVTNWAEYNESLRRRGDLTVWISDDALGLWSAPRRTTRGGQSRYSDLAIETCLTFGMVFKQPLRQTQGLMRSIAKLLRIVIAVPDCSTLSRRGNGLTLQTKPRAHIQAGIHLVVDSTGLKFFGEGALSAACCACACRVRNGLSKSIKPSASGALGESCTSVSILSVARLSVRISLPITSAIRRRWQISWIRSTARLLSFWQTELMMENQHLIYLPLGSDR